MLILEDSGVWQFVAMMPFRLISQSTMWKLLVHLYTLPLQNPPNIQVSSFEEWNTNVIQGNKIKGEKSINIDMTIVQPFVTMLINNNQSVFLLHTLAKIVTESTQEFATSLITELLRISCNNRFLSVFLILFQMLFLKVVLYFIKQEEKYLKLYALKILLLFPFFLIYAHIGFLC